MIYCTFRSTFIPLEADLTIDLKKYCGLHETIVIANPNAPTSLLAPVAAIEEVLQTNPDNIVIVDETYVEFAPAGCVLSAAFGKI